MDYSRTRRKWVFFQFGTGNVTRFFMKRVLIIENQAEWKESFLRQYSDLGYNPDVAGTGLEAFYFIKKHNYDTIIVSNDLSDLNGLWIIKYLRENSESNLILTSFFNHEKLIKQTDSLGISFIPKTI